MRSSVSAGILGFVLVVFSLMWGCPQYSVWQKGLAGKALLKEAEWSRQVRVVEAEAENAAAKLIGEANITKAKFASLSEVERAKGVAEANAIIGESLKNNDAYLRYLWIQGLQDGSSEVIYVPTEGGLPILEAGKRSGGFK